MSPNQLHNALLRPAVLYILRAAGYHSARPSVVDALVDIAARYLLLLASQTASHAYTNHNTAEPDLTDVRMAMQECGLLVPSMTAAEEEWQETIRQPLEEYPDRIRVKERTRRDMEDTKDVRGFVDWVKGKQNQEIRRIAGLASTTERQTIEQEAQEEQEDFLTVLKKKHSKTGEESRFQGTVLGKLAEERVVKIEGAPLESIHAWVVQTQEQSVQQAIAQEADDVDMGGVIRGADDTLPGAPEIGDAETGTTQRNPGASLQG